MPGAGMVPPVSNTASTQSSSLRRRSHTPLPAYRRRRNTPAGPARRRRTRSSRRRAQSRSGTSSCHLRASPACLRIRFTKPLPGSLRGPDYVQSSDWESRPPGIAGWKPASGSCRRHLLAMVPPRLSAALRREWNRPEHDPSASMPAGWKPAIPGRRRSRDVRALHRAIIHGIDAGLWGVLALARARCMTR